MIFQYNPMIPINSVCSVVILTSPHFQGAWPATTKPRSGRSWGWEPQMSHLHVYIYTYYMYVYKYIYVCVCLYVYIYIYTYVNL